MVDGVTENSAPKPSTNGRKSSPFENLYCHNSTSAVDEQNCDAHGSLSISQSDLQLTTDESRDENTQDRSSKLAGLDDRQKNSDEDFKAMLKVLDKNISTATKRKNTAPNNGDCQGIVPFSFSGKALQDTLQHFLRLHNCTPILDNDDESLSYHPRMIQTRDDDSFQHNGARNMKDGNNRSLSFAPTEDEDDDDEDEEELDDAHDTRAQQTNGKDIINSLQSELDNTRENLQQVSTSHIAAMAIQRREYENIVVGKEMLEAQLKATENQLSEAKDEIVKSNLALAQMKARYEKLESKLIKVDCKREDLEERLLEKELAEKGKEKDIPRLQGLVRQLRLDLNEARGTIKRIEKERKKERKHHGTIYEEASTAKASLEIENASLKRKVSLLEKKLDEAREMETKNYAERDDENGKLMAQLVAANAKLKRKESRCNELENHCGKNSVRNEELEYLREMNASLKRALSAATDENQKLREEVRITHKERREVKDEDYGESKYKISQHLQDEVSFLCKDVVRNSRLSDASNGTGNRKQSSTSMMAKDEKLSTGNAYRYDATREPEIMCNNSLKNRLEELHALEKEQFDAARGRFESLCEDFKNASMVPETRGAIRRRDVSSFELRRQERFERLQKSYLENSPQLKEEVTRAMQSMARRTDLLESGNKSKSPLDVPMGDSTEMSDRVKRLKKKYNKMNLGYSSQGDL